MRQTARMIIAALFLGLFAIAAAGWAQVIENPAKPLAKDGGRVLKLTEVWRITDDAGEFFFKYPQDLRIADDGSIFLREAGQFLRFSADGKFLKDIFRKGQGPGEMSDSAFQYYPHGRDLFILHRNSDRFWRADFEGRFQEQYDITKIFDPEFMGVVPEGFLFLTFVWPPRSEFTGKSVPVPQRVVLVARDGSGARDLLKFDRQFFLAPRAARYDLLFIEPSPDGKAVYLYNGWDYLIEVLDAGTGAVLKKFNRRYPKSRIDWTDEQEKRRQADGTPRYEFAPDVNNIFATEEGLWVETSTEDKAKGRLYDVFDKDGRFVDSFYLGPGKILMAVQEEVVFCQEKNEDETIVIVKYRIEN